jgi:archaellum component FlaF (FlaF/FlaG flagellin family)
MKTQIRIYTILVATLLLITAIVWSSWSNKNETKTIAKQAVDSSKRDQSSVVDYTHASNVSITHSSTTPHESVQVEFLDKGLIEKLGISADEALTMGRLFRNTRGKVLHSFAQFGDVEIETARSAHVMVNTPKEQSDAWRAEFYAALENILGKERMAQFNRLENLARFEANFEFFGAFPLLYEFDGDGATLAGSENIGYRRNVTRKDSSGSYQAFSAGKYPLSEFQARFGELAAVVVAKNNP